MTARGHTRNYTILTDAISPPLLVRLCVRQSDSEDDATGLILQFSLLYGFETGLWRGAFA